MTTNPATPEAAMPSSTTRLLDADTAIICAGNLADATDAYMAARSIYYSDVDAGTIAVGEVQAWTDCMDSFRVACDSFRTPIVPLVVLTGHFVR